MNAWYRRIALIASALVAALLAFSAAAQTADGAAVKQRLARMKPADFPTRPIEFTVGGPAGGGMDITTRLLARKFEEYTGQVVVVNNRVGAGGMIANAWLINQAPADGHHIGIIANSIIGDTFLRANSKWSYRDVDSLAFINSEPVVWLVSGTGRYKTASLKEILDEARRQPNDVKVSVISGTLFEMLAEQVEAASGASFIKVPYQGGSASLNALMGDHVDLSFGFVGEFENLGDRVRPLAVASAKPADRLPGVPTFDTVLATQDTQWLFWRFVAAPRGLAPDRRAWLVAALNAALDDPGLREEYRKRGANIDRTGLEEPQRVAAELERMALLERGFYARTGRLAGTK